MVDAAMSTVVHGSEVGVFGRWQLSGFAGYGVGEQAAGRFRRRMRRMHERQRRPSQVRRLEDWEWKRDVSVVSAGVGFSRLSEGVARVEERCAELWWWVFWSLTLRRVPPALAYGVRT